MLNPKSCQWNGLWTLFLYNFIDIIYVDVFDYIFFNFMNYFLVYG